MREYPKATLRILGTNSDEGNELGDTELSRLRAETVRDYLAQTWGIAETRLRVESRNLPELPSNIGELDGIQENRRVEIWPSIPEIIDPVVIDDTLRTVNPPRVRFRPEVTSDAGITEWSVSVRQDDRMLKSFDGKGDVPVSLDWQVQQDKASIPRSTTTLQYSLSLTDAAAQQFTTEVGMLPVEQVTLQKKRTERLGDKEIDRYNLILFDFNSELLGPRNMRIVNMITPRLSPNSTVTITGYTDRIGELRVNQPLSEARAQSAAKALNVPAENAVGRGESDMYTNEIPEGRFYCRTVTILVETPVK
jgi:outer membrane protein OmpA-like peptidoglycan-associated protein